MTVLTAIALVGANAWAVQVRDGMVRTNMTDHVTWGLYIANFTFCVGLAAGGVMMVIPAYLYHDHEMHDVVIVGEILAIAAIVMCHAYRGRRPRPARPLLAPDPRHRPVQLADLDAHLGRDRPQRLPAASTCTSSATCSTCGSSAGSRTRGGTCRSCSSRSSGRSASTR